MLPALLVFDLDGTLVDSRRDIAESANAVLEECGCTPHSEEAIGEMVGEGVAVAGVGVGATGGWLAARAAWRAARRWRLRSRASARRRALI